MRASSSQSAVPLPIAPPNTHAAATPPGAPAAAAPIARAGPSTAPANNVDPSKPDCKRHKPDDILVQSHPHSGVPPTITPLEKFTRTLVIHEIPRPFGSPWAPFATRTDFEFADLCRRLKIGSKGTDELISLIRGIVKDHSSFTLQLQKDAKIAVPLRKEEHSYDMYYRPIWEWVKDLVKDPILAPHFNWNAQKLYKFDGDTWIRFRDEPWTADRWWELQSELPKGASPVGIIFYADKTNLTSFGTQKGYPIVVRCANLPVHIRNGHGVGGGRVVGWLPIVGIIESETLGESAEEADFKRIVWHHSSWKCLESLVGPAQFGEWMIARDGVKRWVFPTIIIVSADYEEQCVIGTNRGTKGSAPCCVCYACRNGLFQYCEKFKARTHKESQELYREAQQLLSKTAKRDHLKPFGIRLVENIFWRIPHLNIYAALSFDRLHTNHLGIWKAHLWAELRMYILHMGVRVERTINAQCALFPRWRNLKHLTAITNITFQDGSTYEDMSKIILFVVHNVVNKDDHPECYALLKCIRSYLNLDIYLSFEVHTDETINATRAELKLFMQLLTEYVDMAATAKDWNFPKIHLLMHVVDDILNKGATRNMNTKPNEQMHGILKETYQDMTNFKDVATQILREEHRRYTADHIRAIITACDEFDKKSKDDYAAAMISQRQFGNVILGSRQRNVMLGTLQSEHQNDPEYANFAQELGEYVTEFFVLNGIALPDGKPIKLSANHKIIEYQLLKCYYASTIDWRVNNDYLHASPLFHGNPRYDVVMVKTTSDNGNSASEWHYFAQILYMFTLEIGNTHHPFALVHPYDADISDFPEKDTDLGFYRIRQESAHTSHFIPLRSVIRGAVVVPTFDTENDFFVVDTIDPDIFFRLLVLYDTSSVES
ncbi:hypothetical protein CERSUDRAFT_46326 [Gelatoporia subvermispora B]|uniref:Uncharacterized protein n=1 Tax=Ceriporiopsis subvermispora (strain B) TaxID=914234 RepID=M2R653_CERS8|nr:hypothetical protein CERSUDRAFT_46326 [Gelatoporia subvermispora B]